VSPAIKRHLTHTLLGAFPSHSSRGGEWRVPSERDSSQHSALCAMQLFALLSGCDPSANINHYAHQEWHNSCWCQHRRKWSIASAKPTWNSTFLFCTQPVHAAGVEIYYSTGASLQKIGTLLKVSSTHILPDLVWSSGRLISVDAVKLRAIWEACVQLWT